MKILAIKPYLPTRAAKQPLKFSSDSSNTQEALARLKAELLNEHRTEQAPAVTSAEKAEGSIVKTFLETFFTKQSTLLKQMLDHPTLFVGYGRRKTDPPSSDPKVLLLTASHTEPEKRTLLKALLQLPGVELLKGALDPDTALASDDAFRIDTTQIKELAALKGKPLVGQFGVVSRNLEPQFDRIV